MCSSESGAKPWHSLILAITPATNVPWPRPEKQDKRLIVIQQSLSLCLSLSHSHSHSHTHTHTHFWSRSSTTSTTSAYVWASAPAIIKLSQPLFFPLTVIQCLFISPVGPLLHVLKMWVFLAEARIKHCYLHTRTCAHKGQVKSISFIAYGNYKNWLPEKHSTFKSTNKLKVSSVMSLLLSSSFLFDQVNI